MGNLWMLDVQRRTAMAQQRPRTPPEPPSARLSVSGAESGSRCASPMPPQFEPIFRREQSQSMRKLSRLIPPGDVNLLNRRISTGQAAEHRAP